MLKRFTNAIRRYRIRRMVKQIIIHRPNLFEEKVINDMIVRNAYQLAKAFYDYKE